MIFSPSKIDSSDKSEVFFATQFLPEITHFIYYSTFFQRNLYYLQKKSVKIKTFFKEIDFTDGFLIGAITIDGWLVIYHDLTRKTQERQAIHKGAYPLRYVTACSTKNFAEFFPLKINHILW